MNNLFTHFHSWFNFSHFLFPASCKHFWSLFEMRNALYFETWFWNLFFAQAGLWTVDLSFRWSSRRPLQLRWFRWRSFLPPSARCRDQDVVRPNVVVREVVVRDVISGYDRVVGDQLEVDVVERLKFKVWQIDTKPSSSYALPWVNLVLQSLDPSQISSGQVLAFSIQSFEPS